MTVVNDNHYNWHLASQRNPRPSTAKHKVQTYWHHRPALKHIIIVSKYYISIGNNVKAAEGETAMRWWKCLMKAKPRLLLTLTVFDPKSRCSNPACKSTESCNFLGKQITQSGSHPWHVQIKQWPIALAHTRMVSDFYLFNFNPCNCKQ